MESVVAGDHLHVWFYLGLLPTPYSILPASCLVVAGDVEQHISGGNGKVSSWETLLALSLLHRAANGASWWGGGGLIVILSFLDAPFFLGPEGCCSLASWLLK